MQILHTLHINKHSIFSAGGHNWDSFPECSGQSQMLVLNSGTRDPFCRRKTSETKKLQMNSELALALNNEN